MKKLLLIALIAALLASCQTPQKKEAGYKVNEAESKAEWKGSTPDHFHVGSFRVTGGLTTDNRGVVKSGDFIIPIASIEDFDLPANIKPALLADLKDNFLKIALHPDAKFHITAIATYNAKDSSAVKEANYLLTGDFSMIGQTQTISFPAKIISHGDSLLTEAKLTIDRLKWGMDNYSDPSKKLYILPGVDIKLNVKAAKAKSPSALAILGI